MKETFESAPLLPSCGEPRRLTAEVLSEVRADAWKPTREKNSCKSNSSDLPDAIDNNLPNFSSSQSIQTCPNAVGSFSELQDFGVGLSAGIVDAAHGFIEFMATPDSVSKALADVGSAFGTAADYYGEKLTKNQLSDIATDSGDMLNFLGSEIQLYGTQSPYDRGRISGKLAAEMLTIEAGLGLSRGMITAESAATGRLTESVTPAFSAPPDSATQAAFTTPAAFTTRVESTSNVPNTVGGMLTDRFAIESLTLESDAANFDRYIASLKRADRVNYKRISKIGSSPEFAELVDNIAERLPDSTQRAIYSRGVEIIPVQCITEVDSRLKPATLGLYTVRDGQRYIFLSEDAHLLADHCGDPVKTIELTLHHEAAHAMDHLPSGRWSSLDSPLKEAFDADFRELDDMTKQRFFLFNGKSSLDRTKKEIVAEIISHRAVPGADPKKGALILGSFPRLAKALDNTRK